jgi:hypothetical protein
MLQRVSSLQLSGRNIVCSTGSLPFCFQAVILYALIRVVFPPISSAFICSPCNIWWKLYFQEHFFRLLKGSNMATGRSLRLCCRPILYKVASTSQQKMRYVGNYPKSSHGSDKKKKKKSPSRETCCLNLSAVRTSRGRLLCSTQHHGCIRRHTIDLSREIRLIKRQWRSL